MFHRAARQRLSDVLPSNIRTGRVTGAAPAREPCRYAAAEALKPAETASRGANASRHGLCCPNCPLSEKPGNLAAPLTRPAGIGDMCGCRAASRILGEVCRSRIKLVRTRRAKSRARLLSGMTSFPAGRAARSAGRKAGRRRVMSRAPGTNRAAPRARNAAHEGKGPGQWLRSSA